MIQTSAPTLSAALSAANAAPVPGAASSLALGTGFAALLESAPVAAAIPAPEGAAVPDTAMQALSVDPTVSHAALGQATHDAFAALTLQAGAAKPQASGTVLPAFAVQVQSVEIPQAFSTSPLAVALAASQPASAADPVKSAATEPAGQVAALRTFTLVEDAAAPQTSVAVPARGRAAREAKVSTPLDGKGGKAHGKMLPPAADVPSPKPDAPVGEAKSDVPVAPAPVVIVPVSTAPAESPAEIVPEPSASPPPPVAVQPSVVAAATALPSSDKPAALSREATTRVVSNTARPAPTQTAAQLSSEPAPAPAPTPVSSTPASQPAPPEAVRFEAIDVVAADTMPETTPARPVAPLPSAPTPELARDIAAAQVSAPEAKPAAINRPIPATAASEPAEVPAPSVAAQPRAVSEHVSPAAERPAGPATSQQQPHPAAATAQADTARTGAPQRTPAEPVAYDTAAAAQPDEAKGPAVAAAPREPAAQPNAPAIVAEAPLQTPPVTADGSTKPAAETPQDFDTLVSRLAEAREAAAPHVVRTAFQHAEFGRVAMQLGQDDNGLSVTLSSADPQFAGAVQAAAASVAAGGAGEQPRQEDRSSQQQNASGQNQQQANLGGNPQGQSQGQPQTNAETAGQRREWGTFARQLDQQQPAAPSRRPDRDTRQDNSGIYA